MEGIKSTDAVRVNNWIYRKQKTLSLLSILWINSSPQQIKVCQFHPLYLTTLHPPKSCSKKQRVHLSWKLLAPVSPALLQNDKTREICKVTHTVTKIKVDHSENLTNTLEVKGGIGCLQPAFLWRSSGQKCPVKSISL